MIYNQKYFILSMADEIEFILPRVIIKLFYRKVIALIPSVLALTENYLGLGIGVLTGSYSMLGLYEKKGFMKSRMNGL
jgi:hypothetical protein